MTGVSAEDFEVRAKVQKVDDSMGLVFGWAIVCKEDGEPYFDTQGDHIPERTATEAFLDFMDNSARLDVQHEGADVGTVVSWWPNTEDVQKAFDIECDRTGILVMVRPDDDETLGKFRSGELSGFSIGGTRIDEHPVEW